MPGFIETLTLLKAGYSKKDIENMIKMDQEESEKKKKEPDPEPIKKDPDPKPEQEQEQEEKKEPDPDYKKLYEDQKKELEKIKKDLSDLQDENIHGDTMPDIEQRRSESKKALQDIVRSFM